MNETPKTATAPTGEPYLFFCALTHLLSKHDELPPQGKWTYLGYTDTNVVGYGHYDDDNDYDILIEFRDNGTLTAEIYANSEEPISELIGFASFTPTV